jgi:hypothetical protein
VSPPAPAIELGKVGTAGTRADFHAHLADAP